MNYPFKLLSSVATISILSTACKKENIKLDSPNPIITSGAFVSRPRATGAKFGPIKTGSKSEIKSRIKRLEAQINILQKKLYHLSEAINNSTKSKGELAAFHLSSKIEKREEILRALNTYREKLIQKDRLQGLLKNGMFVKPDWKTPDSTRDQQAFNKLKLDYPISIGQLFKEDKALTLSEVNTTIAREQKSQARDKANLHEYDDNPVSLSGQHDHKDLYDERGLYRATVRKYDDELRSQYELLRALGESE